METDTNNKFVSIFRRYGGSFIFSVPGQSNEITHRIWEECRPNPSMGVLCFKDTSLLPEGIMQAFCFDHIEDHGSAHRSSIQKRCKYALDTFLNANVEIKQFVSSFYYTQISVHPSFSVEPSLRTSLYIEFREKSVTLSDMKREASSELRARVKSIYVPYFDVILFHLKDQPNTYFTPQEVCRLYEKGLTRDKKVLEVATKLL